MLTTNKFLTQLEDLGYSYIADDEVVTIFSKKNEPLGEVFLKQQHSIFPKAIPWQLKNIVWDFERVPVDKRTGWYVIPLKGLDAGGQRYIYFNKKKEQFGVQDLDYFHGSDDFQFYFSKEDITSELFAEKLIHYLAFVEEA